MSRRSGGQYLKVVYSGGRPLGAYLYLPRPPGVTVAYSKEIAEHLVADYSPDDRVIGVEIVDPSAVLPDQILQALRQLGVTDVTTEELRPLIAA